MKILITGGAGFIGSHLCDALLKRGDSVICVDNFITGSRENIKHLQDNPLFTLVEHNISEPLDVEKVDAVMHLASPASPIDYLQLPIQTLKVGSLGTYHALGIAKKHSAKFLLASTSEVYGDPLEHPQKESYWGNVNPIGTRAVYDEAKRFSEAITMAYHRTHGVDTRIIRIFNTYGPRMRRDDGRVVPAFIGQAIKNEPFTIFGDGSQTRSFCYVSDMVTGMLKLLDADINEPVNVGNPEEHTMIEFANIIKLATGATSEMVFEPLPEDDPKQRKPDITRAQEVMNWYPEVALQDGLQKTIEWFRSQ